MKGLLKLLCALPLALVLAAAYVASTTGHALGPSEVTPQTAAQERALRDAFAPRGEGLQVTRRFWGDHEAQLTLRNPTPADAERANEVIQQHAGQIAHVNILAFDPTCERRMALVTEKLVATGELDGHWHSLGCDATTAELVFGTGDGALDRVAAFMNGHAELAALPYRVEKRGPVVPAGG